jgi:hypothetical protein
MQKYIDQAKAMGLALSDTQVEQIKHLNEDLATMKDQFTGIAVILGSAMVPAVDALIGWIGRLVTSLTPAIQQFGQFLGILLGIPEAAKAVQTAAATVDPAYKLLGTVGGPGTPNVYSNPLTGGVTQNPPMTGAPIAVKVVADEAGGYGHGSSTPAGPAPFVMTPFETAISGLVASIKTDWPPFESTLASVVAGLAPIDWKAFGTDMVLVVNGLTSFMNGPVMQYFDAELGHPLKGQEGSPASWAGGQQNIATNSAGLFFKDLGGLLNGSTTLGQMYSKPDSGTPLTVKDSDMLTKLDTYNTGNVNLVSSATNKSDDSLKKSVDNQAAVNKSLQTSIDQVNATMKMMPALITAAVATGK